MYDPVAKRVRPRVMLAEDDDAMRRVLRTALARDYDVLEASSGTGLLTVLMEAEARGEPPALVISDIRMPGMSGIEALRRLRTSGWTVPIVFMTAFPDDETIAETAALAPVAIFSKPVDVDDVRRAAALLVALHLAERQAGTGEGPYAAESNRDEKS